MAKKKEKIEAIEPLVSKKAKEVKPKSIAQIAKENNRLSMVNMALSRVSISLGDCCADVSNNLITNEDRLECKKKFDKLLQDVRKMLIVEE